VSIWEKGEERGSNARKETSIAEMLDGSFAPVYWGGVIFLGIKVGERKLHCPDWGGRF